jgi:hypothetical protein
VGVLVFLGGGGKGKAAPFLLLLRAEFPLLLPGAVERGVEAAASFIERFR